MRGQSAQASCGQTAAANLLRALGREVTEDQVSRRIKLQAQDGDPAAVLGTTEVQILRVLKAYRIPVTRMTAHEPSLALTSVRGFLLTGRPMVLAVDNNAHWLTVAGLSGQRFIVVDGAHEEITLSYSEQQLVDRWAAAGNPETYYGLAGGKGLR